MGRLLPVILLLLAACSTGPQVRTDYDPTADFARFRSFGFAPRPTTNTGNYSSLTTQRLEVAVGRELQARGFVPAATDPDLLVNFATGLQERLRVVPGPVPFGSWGMQRDPFGWPGYGWGGWGGDRLDAYTEDMLIVELIDRERQQVVWEGTAISQTADPFGSASAAQLDASVAAIFADFAFRAGMPAPVAKPAARTRPSA